MNSHKNFLLILASGGMMLSCFFSGASLILASVYQKPFPLPEAAAILSLAIIITSISSQPGWPRIYAAVLHFFGFFCSSLWFYHRYYVPPYPFWKLGWVPEFYLVERAFSDWFTLVFILLSILILWSGGIRLWTKPTEQTIISRRFDLGLAFWLVLLLIKLVVAVKGGSVPMHHSSAESLLSYVLLGLFSMGLVRTKSTSQQKGVAYIKGPGIVLGFMVITFMLGGGLFILFLPELQTFAEAGGELLESMQKSFGQMLSKLSIYSSTSGPSGNEVPELPSINRSGGQLGILHFLFIGLGIAILIFMAGLIMLIIIRWLIPKLKWLFDGRVEENDLAGGWKVLVLLINAVRTLFAAVWNKFFQRPRTSCAAEKFYRRLLRWGRFSGLSHVISETPIEYGNRLKQRFPQLRNEIEMIIVAVNCEIYGQRRTRKKALAQIQSAQRRMRNPRHWPSRMKVWFTAPSAEAMS